MGVGANKSTCSHLTLFWWPDGAFGTLEVDGGIIQGQRVMKAFGLQHMVQEFPNGVSDLTQILSKKQSATCLFALA